VKVFESSSQRPDGSIAWLFSPNTGIRRAIGLGAASGLAQRFRVMIDDLITRTESRNGSRITASRRGLWVQQSAYGRAIQLNFQLIEGKRYSPLTLPDLIGQRAR
jgi:hypothetical protein